MRRLLALLMMVGAGAAADVDFTVAPQSFALGFRVDYVLGDGHHPFVDDDNRRALLGLQLKAHGHVALLGYAGATVERAVADTGETLAATLPQDAGATDDHVRHGDPGVPIFSVGLPAGNAAYRGLSELRGSVEAIYAVDDAKTVEVPLAKLKEDEVAIDGREDLVLALIEDPDPNRLLVRLSPEARLAVVDLEFRDGAGKAIAIKPPRSDRRDAKPGKRKRQPVGGKDDVLAYTVTLPADASVTVRYYPTVERRRVAFAFANLAFGVVVPDAASARAATQRGADDL